MLTGYHNKKSIKHILFTLMICLPLVVITIASAQSDTKQDTDEQLEIKATLTSKGRGYIQASGKMYVLMERTKLYDITGKVVSMYQVPVPVKAQIMYKNIKGNLPQVVSITIMKDLTPKQRPE